MSVQAEHLEGVEPQKEKDMEGKLYIKGLGAIPCSSELKRGQAGEVTFKFYVTGAGDNSNLDGRLKEQDTIMLFSDPWWEVKAIAFSPEVTKVVDAPGELYGRRPA